MESSCSDYQEDLSSYIDGELDEHQQSALVNHLAGCLDCKENHDHFRGVGRLLQGATARVQESAPDLWEAIQETLPSVCAAITDDLSAFMDNELPPAAHEGITQHLSACDPCQDNFLALTQVNSAVSASMKLPADLEIDIWSKVQERLNQDCVVIKPEISSFVDREVPTLRHRTIAAHITECPDCKDEFSSLSQTGDLLRMHYQPELAVDFDLMPGIKSRIKLVTLEPRQAKQSPFQMRRLTAVAASVLVGLAASATFIFMSNNNGAQMQPVSAEAYLIEQSLGEPGDMQGIVGYERND